MSKEKWVAIEDTINLIDDHIEIRNCCAEYVCNKLNEKNQRIAELEEQLKGCIRPKFKVNDRIFVIVNNEIEEYYVDEVLLKVKGTLVEYRDICKETTITEKNDLFATKEEAQAKLDELKGK